MKIHLNIEYQTITNKNYAVFCMVYKHYTLYGFKNIITCMVLEPYFQNNNIEIKNRNHYYWYLEAVINLIVNVIIPV